MEKTPRDLNLILWGTILLIFDIEYYTATNGTGIEIDLLPDIIGSILICVGVFNLAKISVSNPSYAKSMFFVKIAAVLLVLLTVDEFFVYVDSTFIYYMRQLVTTSIDVSVVVFCMAMIMLSKEKELIESFKNWKIARNLFLFVYVLPYLIISILSSLHLFYIHQIGSYSFRIVLSQSEVFTINPIIAIFLSVLFLLVPIIYGLSCLHSMRREIQMQLL
jgi:hypothetical protein